MPDRDTSIVRQMIGQKDSNWLPSTVLGENADVKSAIRAQPLGTKPRLLSRLLSGSLPVSENQFWTYILENAAGKFYIGSTEDLDRRVIDHNDPSRSRSKYTEKHSPWKLVWSESYATRSEAMAREKQIKGMKSAMWIRNQLLIAQ